MTTKQKRKKAKRIWKRLLTRCQKETKTPELVQQLILAALVATGQDQDS